MQTTVVSTASALRCRNLRPDLDRFRRPRNVIGFMGFALAAFFFSTNAGLCQDAAIGGQDAVAKQKPAGSDSGQNAGTTSGAVKFWDVKSGKEQPVMAVTSQQHPLTAMSLEDMLAAALKDNPDIRVAEAKLREAEAELNRVRLDVAQKVMSFRQDWDVQKAKIEEYETRANEAEKFHKNNAITQQDYLLAKDHVRVNRALLSKLESQLPYLLGRGPQGASVSVTQTKEQRVFALKHAKANEVKQLLAEASFIQDKIFSVGVDERANSVIVSGQPETLAIAAAVIELTDRPNQRWADGPKPRSEMEQKILKALNTPIKASFDEVPLDELLKGFRETFGISFVLDPSAFRSQRMRNADGEIVERGSYPKVTLDLGEVPLAIVLQAIQDTQHVYFGVRDYGIFVSSGMEAQRLGLSRSTAVDFWRTETRKANP